MQPQLSPSSLRCTPFHVGEPDTGFGSRMGGLAPAGVVPSRMTASTRYFLTLSGYPREGIDLSIFLHFSVDQMLESAGRPDFGSLVEVVLHEPRPRGPSTTLASELPPRELIVGEAKEDWFVDQGGHMMVESCHKLGGRPFLENAPAYFEAALDELASAGFAQFIQFDFPALEGDSIVDADWPFATGMFHVFGTPVCSPSRWASIWRL